MSGSFAKLRLARETKGTFPLPRQKPERVKRPGNRKIGALFVAERGLQICTRPPNGICCGLTFGHFETLLLMQSGDSLRLEVEKPGCQRHPAIYAPAAQAAPTQTTLLGLKRTPELQGRLSGQQLLKPHEVIPCACAQRWLSTPMGRTKHLWHLTIIHVCLVACECIFSGTACSESKFQPT